MQVSNKSYVEAARGESRNAIARGGSGSTHHTRATVYQVCCSVRDDCDRRTEPVWIGIRHSRTKNDYLSCGADLRSRLCARRCPNQQHTEDKTAHLHLQVAQLCYCVPLTGWSGWIFRDARCLRSIERWVLTQTYCGNVTSPALSTTTRTSTATDLPSLVAGLKRKCSPIYVPTCRAVSRSGALIM